MSIPTIFHYIPLAVGMVTLLIGIVAISKPEFMSSKFGIPARGAALPYVVSTGVRDIFIGLTILILFYYQDWKLLGLIHLAVGCVAISDFLVVRKHGDRMTSLTHLIAAIFVIPYGVWLLKYF